MDKENNRIIVFEDKRIRRIKFNDEWYYSVVDIIEILTESPTPRQYWGKLKEREFIQLELSPIWVQLKLPAEDGKMRETDCVNTKNAFRLIQSIPSKKADTFKQWLAQLGQDRIDEIQNPELAIERTREYYRLKGYPNDWVEKRIDGIKIRQNLTDEWNNRDVKEEKEYAILTNEIHKATFGKNIKEHKEIKNLKDKNNNLRDHMSRLELIFSMLGEEATTEITKEQDAKGFGECFEASQKGGRIAGNARIELEKETKKKVITKTNYLKLEKQ